jgi:serine/threonine protein kinase
LLGRTLAGRFVVTDHLGSGSIGDVYLATHNLMERQYAIKLLQRRLEQNQTVVQRFRREALATSRITHPNVVHIHDFGQTDDGRFFLIMEYVQGESLGHLIDERLPLVVPLGRALRILSQVAAGIGCAHDNQIVHRDIKPDNIMLTIDAQGAEQVKILDFGLAKVALETAAALTREGEVFGAPGYMAPEQAMARPVDQRADIYAFGAVAYELLTGHPPYECETMHELFTAYRERTVRSLAEHRPPDAGPVPEVLEHAVMRCLAVDPQYRFSQIGEVSRIVDDVLGEHRKNARRRRASVVIDRKNLSGTLGVGDPTTEEDDGVHAGRRDLVMLDAVAAPSKRLVPSAKRSPGGFSRAKHARRMRQASGEEDTVLEAVYEPRPHFVTLDEDEWVHVYRLAVALADKLSRRADASPDLKTLVAGLSELQTRGRALEQEARAHRAHSGELQSQGVDAENRLRAAVLDLTVERTNLENSPGTDPAQLTDLNYQIGQLEGRVSEVVEENHDAIREVEKQIARAEKQLADLEADQLGRVLRLIGQLRRSRPDRLGGEPAKLWKAIESLLPE